MPALWQDDGGRGIMDDVEDPSDRFVAHYVRLSMLIRLVASLLFVALIIWILSDRDLQGDRRREETLFGCFIGLPLFGGVSIFNLRGVLRTAPVVEVGRNGISCMACRGPVPWQDIRRVSVFDWYGQDYVGLWFHDPATVPMTLGARVNRLLTRLFLARKATADVAINMSSTDDTSEALASAIRKYGGPFLFTAE
jgi:hypothetical protein